MRTTSASAEPPPPARAALALVVDGAAGMVKPPVSPGAAGKLAKRANEGVLERARRWLAPVYERYRKNTLTHGEEYLRGDPEIPIGLEVEDWRAIPSLDHISLSRATLTATDSGGILLQGRYGGPLTAAQMLTGSALTEKPENAIGAGVCGMGSTGRWPWDLTQHHWLELDLRTDGRPYEHRERAERAALAAAYRQPWPAGGVPLLAPGCATHSARAAGPPGPPHPPTPPAASVGGLGWEARPEAPIASASHHAVQQPLPTTLLPPRRLVLQCETSFSKTQWVWRAAIPQGPRPAKRAAAFGPHALLGVALDASAEEAQRACSAHTAPPTH